MNNEQKSKVVSDFEFEQGIPNDLFRKVDNLSHLNKKNDTIGKPLKTWKEITKKFFLNPYTLVALTIMTVIIMFSIIVSATSKYSVSAPAIWTNDENMNQLFLWATPAWHNVNESTTIKVFLAGNRGDAEWESFLETLGLLGSNAKLPDYATEGVENGVQGYFITIQILDNIADGSKFILGLDSQGRDIWTRMWVAFGATILLTIAIVLTELAIGIFLGSYLGFNEDRWFDKVIMKVIKVIGSVPTMIWFIGIMFVFQTNSLYSLYLAFVLFGWTEAVKTTRGLVIEIKKQDFIQSAIASGVPLHAQIFGHALPVITGRIIVMSLNRMNNIIALEVAMAMFGFANGSEITLGTILSESSTRLQNWWAFFYPSFIVFMWVLSLQFTARGVKNAFNFSKGGAND